MPEPVEECVKSVLEENPSYSESRAYAICNAAKNKGQLGDFDVTDPMSIFLADHVRAPIRELAHGDVGKVKRVELEDGSVKYTNIKLLSSGEWTDSLSRETIFYSPEGIANSTDNWIDPQTEEPVKKAQLNHFHDPESPGENVGHVPVDSVHAEDGAMYGDLVFHRLNQRSKEMEAMMNKALETEGEEGLGGVSVEIPKDRVVPDPDRNMRKSVEMWFGGVALVQFPAAEDVRMSEQLKNRAIALSGVTEPIHLMQRDMGESTEQGVMGDEPTLIERIRAMKTDMVALERTLQNETDAALQILGQYLEGEGNTSEDPISAFRQWVEENVDEESAAAVMAAIDSFEAAVSEGAPEDGDELTVGDFSDWASGTTEPETPEDVGGELQDPEVEGGGAENPQTAEEVVGALEQVGETVENSVETLKEEVNGVAESQEEVTEQVSQMAARLDEIESATQTRALSEGFDDGSGGGDDEDTEDAEYGPAVDVDDARGVIEQG